MANRMFKPLKGSLSQGVVILTGKFVTTTSGTIAAGQTCDGFTVAKTATKTGRYTITLMDTYSHLRGVVANIEGAADAAYTTAKGRSSILRNVAVSTTKTFDLQFMKGDGTTDVYADAEIEDGASVRLTLFLKDSSVS